MAASPEKLRDLLFFTIDLRSRLPLTRLSYDQPHVPFPCFGKSVGCPLGQRCNGLGAEVADVEVGVGFGEESQFVFKSKTADIDDFARPNKKPGYRSFVSAGTQALDADNRINAGWKNRRAPIKGNRVAEKARVTSSNYIDRFPFGRLYLCNNAAAANLSFSIVEFDLHKNQPRVWDLSGLLAKFFVKLGGGRASRVNMKRRKGNDNGAPQMRSPVNGIGRGGIARYER